MMQSAVRFALSLVLITSVAGTAYHSSTKLRRDGVLNLYPFPRVGRASHRTWQVPVSDLLDEPIKRQLYAFPRVGRSQPLSDFQLEEFLLSRHPFVKRQSFTETQEKDSGMWFGPRLGRSFRSEDDDISQNENEKSEPEQLEPTLPDRQKRQIKQL